MKKAVLRELLKKREEGKLGIREEEPKKVVKSKKTTKKEEK